MKREKLKMKNLILTMVVALGLISCNNKDKESEVLSRVDSIFTEVEAFMHDHRDNLDDNDPQTGKPFSEQIDTDKYLSAHYLALIKTAQPWWNGPLYEHWSQSLVAGTTSHEVTSVEVFEEGDSAIARLIIKGMGERYSSEKNTLVQVPNEDKLIVKLVRERGEWYIDDFRTEEPDYSEAYLFEQFIAFTPFRGDWISIDGDSLNGYYLSDHEISSDHAGTTYYAYELHHDTLQIDEAYYDEQDNLQIKPATTRFATVNASSDTLTVRQQGKPLQQYVRPQE